MTLKDLIVDPSGPYGMSSEAWWALFTTIFFGGPLPFSWHRFWNYFEKRRWRPLRKHLGIMLSWNHGDLGKALYKLKHSKETPNDQFIKIQNEIGLYGSMIVSDSELAKAVGDYMDAVNRLWWWLDWKNERTSATIPENWENDDLPTILRRVNHRFVWTMRRLRTEKKLIRTWQIDSAGICGISGDTLTD